MTTVLKTCALAVLGSALFATLAFGADLDPVIADAPEIGPLDEASGFYVRGDLAYGFAADLDGSLRVDGVGPADAPFTARRGTNGTLDDGAAVFAGLGYQFTDIIRADATLGTWRQGAGAAGRLCDDPFDCRWDASTEVEAVELMANGYLDFGTVMGVTPYLGGGLGAVHLAYDDFADVPTCRTDACGGEVRLEGEDSWRFAYALSAGVAYHVTDALALDVGYRFLDVDGGDQAADGPPASFAYEVRDDGFNRHELRAGLRYSFR